MSQFRNQIAQQERSTQLKQEQSKPQCPHCHSTNVAKIGTGERAAGIIGLGIFSKKTNKSLKCKSCGNTW